jgi:acyl carrier protein phosphodiesterase
MINFEAAFQDVAQRLARDVKPLEMVTTEVAEMPAERFSGQAIRFVGRVPNRFNKVIRLFIAGEWRLDLVFFQDEPFMEQVLNGLSQFQDCVAEGTGEPWPTCPQHYHMMVEDVIGEECIWRCPDNPDIFRKLGCLN